MGQLPADQTESDQLQQTIMEESQEENYQKDIKRKTRPKGFKDPIGFCSIKAG